MDISLWKYKDSDEGDHLGPIAEDFYNSFGLGNNKKYISTVDADGVALAAIKALHEEYSILNKELEIQEDKLNQLMKRLEALEK